MDQSWGREPMEPRSRGLGFRTRLKPFIPYIDKPSSFWSTAAELRPQIRLPLAKSEMVDVIRSWLQACDKGHRKCCHIPPNITLAGSRPIWLVDVIRLCLVPATQDMKYFALSYVWGHLTPFCATIANINTLQKDHALDQLNSIPKTISDAIQLVAQLSERYLWVDCLCILQDDGAHKQDQLNSMGDIYARAIATIVAASGENANAGLRANFDDPEVQYHATSGAGIASSAIRVQAQPRSAIDDEILPTAFYVPSSSNRRHIETSSEQSSPKSLEVELGSSSENEGPDNSSEFGLVDSGSHGDHAGIQINDTKKWGKSSSIFSPSFSYTELLKKHLKDFKSESNQVSDTDQLIIDGEEIMLDQALELVKSKWCSRGWTFQEQLFSLRKIIFQGETINWECGYAAWSAKQGIVPFDLDTVSEERNYEEDPFRFFGMNKQTTPLPDFRRLARLITLYNQRDLKYPEDVLNAFASIIKKLTPQYSGGFITGLPQMLFDSALLWQPYGPLTRRFAKDQTDSSGGFACLPSWSWVGWQGDIQTESWRSAYDFMKGNQDEFYEGDEKIWQQTSWRTISTVEWFRLDSLEGDGSKHRIHVNGQQYRDSALLGNVANHSLPGGWTRHESQELSTHFFRHEADTSREFWYPIPLVDSSNTESTMLPHVPCRFLWCQTRRAFLELGQSFHNELTSRCSCEDLLDEFGNWAGVLRHHVRRKTQEMENVTKAELIELSAGSVLNQGTEEVSFDEWFRNDPCGSAGKYEFYNVMAIKWVEGVAYREGVGRVRKDIWERLATEKVKVVLG